jgi:hypothetical protein
MPGRFALIAVGLLAGLPLGACYTAARRDASSGHVGCAPADITISNEGGQTWDATCNGTLWHCSAYGSGEDVDVACMRDADAASTSGPGAPPQRWTAPFLLRHYATLDRGIRACVLAPEVRFFITYDARGHAVGGRFATAHPAEAQRCIIEVIQNAPLGRRVQAQQTHAQITLSQGAPIRVRIVEAIPGAASDSPARPASDSPEPDAAEETVRAAIDRSAARVLACSGGVAVALRARWDAAGTVFVGLPGVEPDVVGCVRAAVGTVTVPAGRAGSLLHPVAPP